MVDQAKISGAEKQIPNKERELVVVVVSLVEGQLREVWVFVVILLWKVAKGVDLRLLEFEYSNSLLLEQMIQIWKYQEH